ncbi:MAG TPA: PEP-CTERM sorting domain-containing protein [Lamprocystis sp. (in: g-proteobacteria)]|nr:PEP-CTERM sorting domain-containing protein [Lamprocystis sp. (in: g-proteobacteria)]
MDVLTLLVGMSLTAPCAAALVARPGGLVYDDVLDVTWLADANYARTSGYSTGGQMSWQDAKAWAASLVYGGFDDWRLPATPQPDPSCREQYDAGPSYPPQGYDLDCTGSELGYMFYSNLGGQPDTAVSVSHNASFTLFSNVEDVFYWSGSAYAPRPGALAWRFNFANGKQSSVPQAYTFAAWAVHDGDIDGTSVPAPATGLLLGIGLIGLLWRNRTAIVAIGR